jgi:outer membrane protein insertion porin family
MKKLKNRSVRAKAMPICLAVTAAGIVGAVPAVAQTPTAGPSAPPVASGTSRISKIIVKGNKVLSSSAIIIASGHNVGDPCNEQTLDEMKLNLTETGNFGIQHNPDDRESWVKVYSEESNGQCTVVIEVDENDLVKNVQITGSGPISNEEILKLIHFKPNSPSIYNPLLLGRDDKAIEQEYNKRGYIAVIGQDESLDAKTGVLTIPIIVTRVSEIKIAKTHKTRRSVILREMKTKIGDYFNRKTWNDDLQRIYNLNLFDDVVPREDLTVGQAVLTLSLPEKRSGNINVGAGYSSQQRIIGRAEVSDSNFRGMGENLSLLLESGGIVNQSSVVLSFVEPWIDNKHTALSVSVYDKTVYRFANSLVDASAVNTTVGTDTRYNEQRIGATVSVSRPLGKRYTGVLTARAETVHTDSLALGGIDASILQNGPIFVLGALGQHDTRDVPLDPAAGSFQSVGISVGHANLTPPSAYDPSINTAVFGPHTFAKVSLEGRQFFSLKGPRKKPTDSKPVLAMRLLLGSSAGTEPFFEQFFVGGAETLRGYREDRFWGKNMFLTSIEMRQPLGRSLTGVLFTDVGDAWGGGYSNVNIAGFHQTGFSPHVGVGLGIRVRTPLGPIRLDYGIGNEGGQTHFSIGHVF